MTPTLAPVRFLGIDLDVAGNVLSTHAESRASDLTDDAVAATRRNVEQLDLGDRFHCVQGNIFLRKGAPEAGA